MFFKFTTYERMSLCKFCIILNFYHFVLPYFHSFTLFLNFKLALFAYPSYDTKHYFNSLKFIYAKKSLNYIIKCQPICLIVDFAS